MTENTLDMAAAEFEQYKKSIEYRCFKLLERCNVFPFAEIDIKIQNKVKGKKNDRTGKESA